MEQARMYMAEKCECGHIAPTVFTTYDKDGNGACPDCVIEELQDRIKKLKLKLKAKKK